MEEEEMMKEGEEKPPMGGEEEQGTPKSFLWIALSLAAVLVLAVMAVVVMPDFREWVVSGNPKPPGELGLVPTATSEPTPTSRATPTATSEPVATPTPEPEPVLEPFPSGPVLHVPPIQYNPRGLEDNSNPTPEETPEVTPALAPVLAPESTATYGVPPPGDGRQYTEGDIVRWLSGGGWINEGRVESGQLDPTTNRWVYDVLRADGSVWDGLEENRMSLVVPGISAPYQRRVEGLPVRQFLLETEQVIREGVVVGGEQQPGGWYYHVQTADCTVHRTEEGVRTILVDHPPVKPGDLDCPAPVSPSPTPTEEPAPTATPTPEPPTPTLTPTPAPTPTPEPDPPVKQGEEVWVYTGQIPPVTELLSERGERINPARFRFSELTIEFSNQSFVVIGAVAELDSAAPRWYLSSELLLTCVEGQVAWEGYGCLGLRDSDVPLAAFGSPVEAAIVPLDDWTSWVFLNGDLVGLVDGHPDGALPTSEQDFWGCSLEALPPHINCELNEEDKG